MTSTKSHQLFKKTINDEIKAVFTWVTQGYKNIIHYMLLRSPDFTVDKYTLNLAVSTFPDEIVLSSNNCIMRIKSSSKNDDKIYYKYTFTNNKDDENLINYGPANYAVYHWSDSNSYDVKVSTFENDLLKNDDLAIIFEIFITKKDLGNDYDGYIKKFDYQDKIVNFGSYLNDKKFSDVSFSVEGTIIHAHRIILASQSVVFSSMFYNKGQFKVSARKSASNTIVVNGIQYCYFEKFLRYLYDKHIDNLKEDAKELITIAEKYSVQNLKDICEESLCESATIEDADELLRLALLNNALNLKKTVINLIINKLEVLTESSFLELTEEKQCLLASVFSRDNDVQADDEGECEDVDD